MTCFTFVVAREPTFAPLHHLRRGDEPEFALCGALVPGDARLALSDWGSPRSPLEGRWCLRCADVARDMGLDLRREHLVSRQRVTASPPFDGEFFRRFPMLYADWLRPVGATPLWERGIEVGAGWVGVVERLSCRLEDLIGSLPVDMRRRTFAAQAKQKAGRLRVYLEGHVTPAMAAAIQDAADEASQTCERCGLRHARPGVCSFCDRT